MTATTILAKDVETGDFLFENGVARCVDMIWKGGPMIVLTVDGLAGRIFRMGGETVQVVRGNGGAVVQEETWEYELIPE